jgi:uncharacterized membrane protein YfcA
LLQACAAAALADFRAAGFDIAHRGSRELHYIQMDIAFAFSGFVVGALVGLTGMGGGSVMTPMLILLFGVHPVAAVGTDLLFASVTKATGTRIHAYRGNVDWQVVALLAAGSVPATLGTLVLVARVPEHNPALAQTVTVAIGAALLVAAAGLLFGQAAERLIGKVLGDQRSISPAATQRLTAGLGFLLGALVSLTSIGAGAAGIVVLRHLYPRIPVARLVGSDLAHAVPLTLLAGSGHWLIGDIQWPLLLWLLCGSLPGVIIASRFANRIPEHILRRVLGLVLTGIAASMLMR